MSDMVKIWLEQLYADEIEDVEGTISNERCFMKGSTDEEEASMHENNIEELEEYLEILKELKAEVE